MVLPLLGGEGRGEGERLSNFLTGVSDRSVRFLQLLRTRVIQQRMRRALLQRSENGFANVLSVTPQAGIPITQHFDAARNQKSLALGIVRLPVGMPVTKTI